jgi:hypothetical protein
MTHKREILVQEFRLVQHLLHYPGAGIVRSVDHQKKSLP